MSFLTTILFLIAFIAIFFVNRRNENQGFLSLSRFISKSFETKIIQSGSTNYILITLPKSRMHAKIWQTNTGENEDVRSLFIETQISEHPKYFAFTLKKKFSMLDLIPLGMRNLTSEPNFSSLNHLKDWYIKVDSHHSLLEIFDMTMFDKLKSFETLTPKFYFNGKTLTLSSQQFIFFFNPLASFERFCSPSVKSKWETIRKQHEEFPSQCINMINFFDELASKIS